VYIDLRQVTGA